VRIPIARKSFTYDCGTPESLHGDRGCDRCAGTDAVRCTHIYTGDMITRDTGNDKNFHARQKRSNPFVRELGYAVQRRARGGFTDTAPPPSSQSRFEPSSDTSKLSLPAQKLSTGQVSHSIHRL